MTQLGHAPYPHLGFESAVPSFNSACTGSNAAGGANDLFRDKPLRPERRVMVEQDPIGGKQAVGVAIVDHRAVCGSL